MQLLYALAKLRTPWLDTVLGAITNCGCERGCPSCVGPENEIGSDGKLTALELLEEVMQYERS